MKTKRINTPLTSEKIKGLRAGDKVLITGTIYTARDQAHKRLVKSLKEGKRIPIGLKDVVIYYCGPTPARPGTVIGACGPTTSSRMDPFTGPMLKSGMKGMIGKGERSKEVVGMIKKYRAVYFAAVGGAGAYLSSYITGSSVVAYDDLGAEAIREIRVKDFPVIVAVDSNGKNIFER